MAWLKIVDRTQRQKDREQERREEDERLQRAEKAIDYFETQRVEREAQLDWELRRGERLRVRLAREEHLNNMVERMCERYKVNQREALMHFALPLDAFEREMPWVNGLEHFGLAEGY